MALKTVTKPTLKAPQDVGTLPAPARLVRENGEVYVEIAEKKIPIGGPLPKLRQGEKHIRVTSSLCPYCMRLLPARVFDRGGKVYIRKICPDHGEVEELYFGDTEMYHRMMQFEETGKGPGKVKAYLTLSAPCPYNCGLCSMHENHTALANLVITNRCNIACFYCFFYAEKAGYVYEPEMELLRFQVRQLKKQGFTMVVQITGGEPTVREDLVDIVRMLKEEGVRHVQLNTNAIRFAELYFEDPEYAVEYTRQLRQAGVNTVYMSFDGVTPKVNWKNHYEVPFAFEVFRKAGMTSVVLVPTVIKTINDHELGDIIRFASKHIDIVRAVNYQPVSLSGQMKKHERERMRITIADAIHRIAEQTDYQVPPEAWFPIPAAAKFAKFIESVVTTPQFCMSNHPMCGAGTYIFVERDASGLPKKIVPLTDFFDVVGFMEWLDQKRIDILNGSNKKLALLRGLIDLRKFVDKSKLPKGLSFEKLLINVFLKRNYDALGKLHYHMLFLGMMHFMDLYNYDVTRVRRCNIHYLSPDGRVIPFCTFNVMEKLYRDYVQEQYKQPLELYIKDLETKAFNPGEKYNRAKYIKMIKEHPIYKEAYKGIIF
ncbi:MAG: radical SAM protein [Desulfurococcales archaeon]|nr:radical SAM protein [Desulfurococcales archaeon]